VEGVALEQGGEGGEGGEGRGRDGRGDGVRVQEVHVDRDVRRHGRRREVGEVGEWGEEWGEESGEDIGVAQSSIFQNALTTNIL
jgi:hypothetical protein